MKTLCPICKMPLNKTNHSACCQNGHNFDFAKEGYLYLLKPNDKNSHDPGDNKDMVSARKNFLDGDFYKPLAEQIANVINKTFPLSNITLVDAGVGTGYYLKNIIAIRQQNFANNGDTYLGADISKHAVKYASKCNPQAECCVASVFNLPYADKSADVITCVFSPYAMTEYARVLKDDGILIVASPGEEHLIELRQALYDNVRGVESEIIHTGFDIVDNHVVKFDFALENEQISNLLTMTPYIYRAPLSAVEKVKACKTLSLTADFRLAVCRKSIS